MVLHICPVPDSDIPYVAEQRRSKLQRYALGNHARVAVHWVLRIDAIKPVVEHSAL